MNLENLKAELKPIVMFSIPTIVISAGTCGQASGANDLIRIAKRELIANGLTNRIHLRITGCHGFVKWSLQYLLNPPVFFTRR